MIISIDGNIGSGKSTILDELKKRGYHVFKEGTDKWYDILESFYENKSRWAFTLQVSILQDMHEKYMEASKINDDVIFFERNPITSLLFVQNSFENNHLNNVELKHYMQLHKLLSWHPDKIIKLDVPSSTCYERILSRKDPATKTGLNLEYVKMLEQKYKNIHDESVDGSKPINEVVNAILEKIDFKNPSSG